MSTTVSKRSSIDYLHELDFIGIHLVPLLAIFTGTRPFDWILCGALYVVRMFFVTGVYHRYFSHRSYKTSRWFQFILACGAQSTFQKGVLWWAANHRIHHKHSDTEEDPHSAKLYGFWYAHIGWIMSPDFKATRYDLIKDWKDHKELHWLNKYHWVPAVVLAVAVYFVGNKVNGTGWFDWSAGLSTLFIGFFLSTILLFHGTFTINSLMHKIGGKRYNTGDESRNSAILALVTLGEGWHNNHHYYQSSVRQGFYWWEFDITFYILKTLSAFGLVWDLRGVPKKVKDSNKVGQAATAMPVAEPVEH